MSNRNQLLQSIATIITDYQSGILPMPTPAHVNQWIDQFPAGKQLHILAEMEHVLSKTYFSKAKVESFMRSVIGHNGWIQGDAVEFWRATHFLNLQPQGNSQRELLALFDQELAKITGLSIAQCGKGNRFVYIDDGLFSGGRLGSDLKSWIENVAPQNAELIIATIAVHTQGLYFTKRSLNAANTESGKNLTIKWGHLISIEDGIFEEKVNASDVLRPTGPGTDPAVAAYIVTLGKDQTWRAGASVGPKQFFSSDQGRQVLEQEFLKAGVAVRDMCPLLNAYQRPLGNTTMRTIGFGTMFATYRNCPNNAPLVLWAGDPWYPLLRRVTN